MTREEAIKLIEHISITFVPTDQYGDYDDPQPYEDALDMAIEALQDLSKPNNGSQGSDLISRQDAVEALMNDPDWADAIPTIESLPSADRPTGWIPVSEALPSKGQIVLDIDDKETWGDKGTWDVDKQRGW